MQNTRKPKKKPTTGYCMQKKNKRKTPCSYPKQKKKITKQLANHFGTPINTRITQKTQKTESRLIRSILNILANRKSPWFNCPPLPPSPLLLLPVVDISFRLLRRFIVVSNAEARLIREPSLP